ncbi:hypothetical protein OSTOST_19721 [Ostertagia ostertagi]
MHVKVSAKQDSVMRAEQQQSTMKRSPSQSIASTSTEEDSDSSQNLRLNAKIGTLVSDGNATIKKEVLDLKVGVTYRKRPAKSIIYRDSVKK